MECPACTAAGRPAGALVRFSTDDLTLRGCSTCRGVFVSARAWCSLLLSPERMPKLPSACGSSGGAVALLRCPACRKELERGRFAGRSAVTVDLCDRHGLWLDAEELPGILRYCVEGERSLSAAERAPVVVGPPMTTPNMHLRGGGGAGGMLAMVAIVLLATLLSAGRATCARTHGKVTDPGQGTPAAEPAGPRR